MGERQEIIKSSIDSWLSRWEESDPRTEVFSTYGVLVRRPCVAALLIETSNRTVEPTGWRHSIAMVLAATLRQDMPEPLVAEVLGFWNGQLTEPLSAVELGGVIRDSHKYEYGCEHDSLKYHCTDEDTCDHYAWNFVKDGERPFGSAAIYDHGVPDGIDGSTAAFYEGICRLEQSRGLRPGATVETNYPTFAAFAHMSAGSVRKHLQSLHDAGYIEFVVGENKKGGRPTKVKRLFPLPLHLNDDLTDITAERSSRESSPVTVDSSVRSDILERFLADYTVEPDDDTLHYLLRRGLSRDTIASFGIRYLSQEAYGHAKRELLSEYGLATLKSAGLFNENDNLSFWKHHLLIPYFEDGRVVYIKGRDITATTGEKRYMNLSRSAPMAFNVTALESDSIVVCEGEMDTMSVTQLGLPAIGLLQAKAMSDRLVRRLSEKKGVVMALDNDDGGKSATGANLLKLRRAGVKVTEFELGEHGDINEWLVADGDGLKSELEAALSA